MSDQDVICRNLCSNLPLICRLCLSVLVSARSWRTSNRLVSSFNYDQPQEEFIENKIKVLRRDKRDVRLEVDVGVTAMGVEEIMAHKQRAKLRGAL